MLSRDDIYYVQATMSTADLAYFSTWGSRQPPPSAIIHL